MKREAYESMRLPKDLLLLPSETDSYRRAWTFPTDENGTPKDTSATPESRSDSQKVQPPPDDTEEFLNGWNFE